MRKMVHASGPFIKTVTIPWPQYQVTNKESRVLRKEIRFIIHQMKRRAGGVNSRSSVSPLWRENVWYLRSSLRGLLRVGAVHIPEQEFRPWF
jgi:hypothetical protein